MSLGLMVRLGEVVVLCMLLLDKYSGSNDGGFRSAGVVWFRFRGKEKWEQ